MQAGMMVIPYSGIFSFKISPSEKIHFRADMLNHAHILFRTLRAQCKASENRVAAGCG